MDHAPSSSEIISECLKRYGKGQLFFRRDGLEFEARRARQRQDYLESHSQIDEQHRHAIARAAVTPGMTRDEVVAAWGLLSADTRMSFGHVTDDRRAAYAVFTGFAVGEKYALYFQEDVLVGIRETDYLVPPHEEEITMRLAEERYGLYYFYEGHDDNLVGSDRDQHHIDWDSLHLHLYRIEPVPAISISSVEANLKVKGVLREYELGLLRLGYQSGNAPIDVRKRVALSVMPYPYSNEREPDDEQSSEPVRASSEPIALPSSSLDHALHEEESVTGRWFDYVNSGHRREAAFLCENGFELVGIEWIGQEMFEVRQVPLRVDDVSLSDLIEIEWRAGDRIPWFKHVIGRRGRTIRATVLDDEGDAAVKRFVKMNVEGRWGCRYEEGLVVFTITEPKIDAIAKEWLSYLPVSWVYTDTLSQD